MGFAVARPVQLPRIVPAQYRVHALVEVQNLAYVKSIALYGTWSYRGSDWLDVAYASYVGPAGDGAENWEITTPWHPGALQRQAFTFDLRYDVSGRSYWDNAGGADYCVGLGDGPCEGRVWNLTEA